MAARAASYRADVAAGGLATIGGVGGVLAAADDGFLAALATAVSPAVAALTARNRVEV